MTRRGAGVALIERPIDEAIEKHRRCPREDHAGKHKEQRPHRRPAIRSHYKCAKGKWEGKNRVGKTNQPEKPCHRPAKSARLPLSILSVHSN